MRTPSAPRLSSIADLSDCSDNDARLTRGIVLVCVVVVACLTRRTSVRFLQSLQELFFVYHGHSKLPRLLKLASRGLSCKHEVGLLRHSAGNPPAVLLHQRRGLVARQRGQSTGDHHGEALQRSTGGGVRLLEVQTMLSQPLQQTLSLGVRKPLRNALRHHLAHSAHGGNLLHTRGRQALHRSEVARQKPGANLANMVYAKCKNQSG